MSRQLVSRAERSHKDLNNNNNNNNKIRITHNESLGHQWLVLKKSTTAYLFQIAREKPCDYLDKLHDPKFNYHYEYDEQSVKMFRWKTEKICSFFELKTLQLFKHDVKCIKNDVIRLQKNCKFIFMYYRLCFLPTSFIMSEFKYP